MDTISDGKAMLIFSAVLIGYISFGKR
jgi:hypothetical protein